MTGQRTIRRTTARRSRARVALALLASVICPSAQVITSLHEASVRHVMCAQHGELTHVSAIAPDGVEDSQEASRTARGEASLASHEHCAEAGIVHRHQSLQAPKQGPAPALVLASGVGEPARYIAPGTRLLLSAPKTSPPVA